MGADIKKSDNDKREKHYTHIIMIEGITSVAQIYRLVKEGDKKSGKRRLNMVVKTHHRLMKI